MKVGSLAGLALSAGLFVGCSGLPLGSLLSTPPRVSDVRIVQEGDKTGVAYTWADPAEYSPEGTYTIVDWGNTKKEPSEVWKGEGKHRRVFRAGSPEFAVAARDFEKIRARAPGDRGYWPEDAPDRWYERAVGKK